MIGFILFPRVLAICENAISLVQDLNSCRCVLFYDDNLYTTGTIQVDVPLNKVNVVEQLALHKLPMMKCCLEENLLQQTSITV